LTLCVCGMALVGGLSCVRGNHEDRILLVHKDLNSTLLPLKEGSSDPESVTVLSQAVSNLDDESFSRGDYSDRVLARQLNKEQHEYLSSCPVILRVGYLGPLGEVVAVHAGLVPGLPLEHQDPFSVMSMRSIDLDTHVPSKSPATGASGKEGTESESDRRKSMALVPWTKLWNKYQNLLPNPARKYMRGDKLPQLHTTVVYGHDSHRGLQMAKWSLGIDTGCVKGDRLTALIVGDGGRMIIRQVPCKDYRPRRPLEVEVEDVLRDGQVSGRSADYRRAAEVDEA